MEEPHEKYDKDASSSQSFSSSDLSKDSVVVNINVNSGLKNKDLYLSTGDSNDCFSVDNLNKD